VRSAFAEIRGSVLYGAASLTGRLSSNISTRAGSARLSPDFAGSGSLYLFGEPSRFWVTLQRVKEQLGDGAYVSQFAGVAPGCPACECERPWRLDPDGPCARCGKESRRAVVEGQLHAYRSGWDLLSRGRKGRRRSDDRVD
jgi:hypothetical protein